MKDTRLVSVKLLNDLAHLMHFCQRRAGLEHRCVGCELAPFCEAFNGGTKLLSQAVHESLEKLEENMLE